MSIDDYTDYREYMINKMSRKIYELYLTDTIIHNHIDLGIREQLSYEKILEHIVLSQTKLKVVYGSNKNDT